MDKISEVMKSIEKLTLNSFKDSSGDFKIDYPDHDTIQSIECKDGEFTTTLKGVIKTTTVTGVIKL